VRDAWPHGDNSPYYRIFVLLSRAYHILFEGTKVCTAAAIDEAKACLEECAKLCQTHLPVEMCTYNLHTLVCHVLEACAQTGSAGAATELYVERAIRRIVRCTRARATKNVGAFLMNESLLSSCVTRLSETIKLTLDDLAPSRRPAVLLSRVAGATMVEEPRADGDYFSTVGKRDYLVGPDGAAQRALLNEWFARSEPTINFATLGDDDFVCHRFGTVVRAGVEVHSRAYTRVQSRVSWHVAIDFVGQGLHFGLTPRTHSRRQPISWRSQRPPNSWRSRHRRLPSRRATPSSVTACWKTLSTWRRPTPSLTRLVHCVPPLRGDVVPLRPY
jgi:hypothetical protein